MKPHETKTFGPTKVAIQFAATLGLFISSIFWHTALMMSLSAAALLTVSFCLQPQLFRDRSGPLVPIFCFLTVAWLGAIGMFLYWFFSRH